MYLLYLRFPRGVPLWEALSDQLCRDLLAADGPCHHFPPTVSVPCMIFRLTIMLRGTGGIAGFMVVSILSVEMSFLIFLEFLVPRYGFSTWDTQPQKLLVEIWMYPGIWGWWLWLRQSFGSWRAQLGLAQISSSGLSVSVHPYTFVTFRYISATNKFLR